jgi:hypothetical protein
MFLLNFAAQQWVLYLNIVPRLHTGQPGDRNLICHRCRGIPLLQNIPMGCGALSASFSVITCGSFQGIKDDDI